MYKFSIPFASFTMIALFLIFSFPISAQFDDDFFVTNEFVSDMVKDGDDLYIAGYFTYVGPNTGRAALLDYGNGTYNSTIPKVNGTVYVCVSDNNGGWFIGGDFTKVGSEYRNGLAHITSSGTVSSWNPGTNGTVFTIFLDNETLYVGGIFSSVGGAARDYAGAVDATSGIPTNWNPDPNGIIYSIKVGKDVAYIGGNFTKVNKSTSNTSKGNLASVSKDLGVVSSWQCDVVSYSVLINFVVYGLELTNNDSTLYVWGNIGTIAGTTRRGIGRVNTYASNSVQSWNPNALYSSSSVIAGTVYSVKITEGDTVFIGGLFSRMRTTTTLRNNIAAVTKTGTPTVYSWNPNIYADWYSVSTNYRPTVYSIEVKNDIVYAGGKFNLTGATRTHNLVAIDRATGSATAWDPHVTDSYYNSVNGNVYTILNSDSGLFIGGSFPSVNGKTRNSVAKINLQDNTIYDWDPQIVADGGWPPMVENIALYNSTLFVGGSFESVGGTPQTNFAAVDKNTAALQTFVPFANISPVIRVLTVKNGKLYISGNFTAAGDSTRNRVACIDLNTQQVTAWDPQLPTSTQLYTIAFSDSLIYITGDFSSVRGEPRAGMAAVDYDQGIPTSWDPNNGSLNSGVLDMEVYNNLVYVGGQFDYIGTTSRKCLAAIDFDGNITSWNPTVELGTSITRVWDFKIAGSNMYIGGDFQKVNGSTRRYIASIDVQTGTLNSWGPKIVGEIYEIEADQNTQKVYFGGIFTNVDDNACFRLASYTDPSLVTAITLNLTALIEGFYDGSTMVSDTVIVELHNSSSPYALVDQSKILLDNNGQGTGTFSNAKTADPYYLVVKHRNSIETWSKTTQSFSGGTLNYDFTTATTQAYGDNLKLKLGNYCIFSGDVNQDGSVDLSDLVEVDNDNANFVTGYVPSDVDGNNTIDLSDMIIVDNNNAAFVGKVTP